jgi:hypothetical protein
MSTTTKSDYMLLFRSDEWYTTVSADELEAAMTKAKVWFEDLHARGLAKGGAPLGREGQVITRKNGRMVADGPFAESKETIGGYLTLSVGSLDEAIAIAKSSPMLLHGGSIEVRPVAEECPLMSRAKEIFSEEKLALVGA